jgi:hypothetical protein
VLAKPSNDYIVSLQRYFMRRNFSGVKYFFQKQRVGGELA